MNLFANAIGALSALFVAILCFHWFFKDLAEFKDCLRTFHPERFSAFRSHLVEEAGKTLQLAAWTLVWLGSGLMAGWFVLHF